MAQTLLALDVSNQMARAVVVEASFRTAEVVSAIRIPLPENPDEHWAAIVKALPRQYDAIATNLPGRNVSTRLLTFPFEDLRKVEAAVEFELESQIPYGIEDVAATWHIGRRGEGQAHVLAAVTPKEDLEGHLAQMSQAGMLDARLIGVPAAGLAELLPQDSTECCALVCLGGSESHLVIGQGDLHYARTLRWGGNLTDQALASTFNVSEDEARAAKENDLALGESADPQMQKAAATVASGLATLARELTTTFRSLPDTMQPTKVYVTGGASKLKGLAQALTEQLERPVEALDLRQAVEPTEITARSLGPEFAPALGMAMTLLRRGKASPMNFRRGEFAYHGDLQVYRGEIVRLAVGIAAVLFFAVAGSVIRYQMLAAEERRIDQGFCNATKRIVGREICNPTAALATLQQAPTGEGGVVIPPYSASDLFETVSKTLGTDLDVTFNELDFRAAARSDEADRIEGKGEAASFEATEQVVDRLKKDPCVTSASVSKQKKTRDGGRVEFNFEAKVQCPAGTKPGSNAVAQAPPTPPVPGVP